MNSDILGDDEASYQKFNDLTDLCIFSILANTCYRSKKRWSSEWKQSKETIGIEVKTLSYDFN